MIATNASVPRLKIVVLAAGFSSRLGSPKALARIHGVSLLRHTVTLACALRPAAVIVVVPPAASLYAAQVIPGIILARNRERSRGLSTSVRWGLKQAWYCSAVLLLPVDLAHLKLRELRRLVSRWRSAPGRIHATRIGSTGGAPMILPKRLFPQALRITGDVGLRGLIGKLPGRAITLIELPSARCDVDTARELQAARRRWIQV